jgi:8-oxo-dGTP diphosphatase
MDLNDQIRIESNLAWSIQMLVDDFSRQYPHLFQEVTWPRGPTLVRFIALDDAPPNYLIANVNIVPCIGDHWVVIQLADGSWEIPGGTLEPGEDAMNAILRELKEEVGAELISQQVIGAWSCLSLADKPYRPHLPFPQFYRLVFVGEISIVKSPANPPGGENVTSVESLPLQTCVDLFISQGRFDLAELYQLASRLHH